MKKGQAAMEFLMTYGWAILVVLAAIGALAYFGVLSPDKLLPSKCTLSPGFDFGDCKAAIDGLKISIYNGMGADVKNTTVVINATQGSDVPCTETWDVGVLANGQTTTVQTMCTVGAPHIEGERFDSGIKIIYTKSGETESHTVTGTITRRVEI